MIIKTDTHVLLIKPTYRPYWEFPGGAVEKGETPEDAAIREVAEEASIQVETIRKQVAVHKKLEYGIAVTIHVYLAGRWKDDGKWKAGIEIGSREYFPIDKLPTDVADSVREILYSQFPNSGSFCAHDIMTTYADITPTPIRG